MGRPHFVSLLRPKPAAVTMSKSMKEINPVVKSVGLLLSTCLVLQGCVVRVAPPPPVYVAPPPRVYAPPPPPEYVPPAEEEVQTNEAPPPLPDYDQPLCPEDGYIWTPGYWRWAGGAYYWVPGTWVQPPRVGVLWTPGYWGFVGGVYAFHAGYWGPHVGFYGGVNYGYGYGGVGFVGGRWAGNSFAYNTTITHVNVTVIHNTYNQTIVNNITVNKVSYNGGAGGVIAALVLRSAWPPRRLMCRRQLCSASMCRKPSETRRSRHESMAVTRQLLPRRGRPRSAGLVLCRRTELPMALDPCPPRMGLDPYPTPMGLDPCPTTGRPVHRQCMRSRRAQHQAVMASRRADRQMVMASHHRSRSTTKHRRRIVSIGPSRTRSARR